MQTLKKKEQTTNKEMQDVANMITDQQCMEDARVSLHRAYSIANSIVDDLTSKDIDTLSVEELDATCCAISDDISMLHDSTRALLDMVSWEQVKKELN